MVAGGKKIVAVRPGKVCNSRQAGERVVILAGYAVFFVLSVSGLSYRYLNAKVQQAFHNHVKLPQNLNNFPLSVGEWKGWDVELDEAVIKAAGNDDYLNRIYKNSFTGSEVSLYISYSGNPRTMIGHRPERCYTGSGWIHEGVKSLIVALPGGGEINANLHEFSAPFEKSNRIFVGNYYLINGKVVSGEKGFSGLSFRTPNFAGDPARYVAQVQISSANIKAVKNAIKDFADSILNFMPGGCEGDMNSVSANNGRSH